MKRYLLIILTAALLTSAYLQLNVQRTTALADGDTSTLTVECTAPSATGYVPDVSYAISWSPAHASNNPTCTAVATLGDGSDGGIVENENPTPETNCNLADSGPGAGTVIMMHNGPRLKMAGMQCQTVGTVTVNVKDLGDAGPGRAVNLNGDGIDIMNSAYKVDDQADGKNLRGPSGLAGAAVMDGTPTDWDGQTNGEVVIGATASPYVMAASATVINADPTGLTEVLTFIFTAYENQ